VPTGQTQLSANPAFHDYGDVAQTNSISHSFTLSNNSNAALYIASIARSNSAAFSVIHNCPLSPLAFSAAATCDIELSFSPHAEGAHNTQVSVIHGLAPASSSNLSFSFYAQGRSTAASSGNPKITFTPDFKDFGDTAAGQFSEQSFTVENISAESVYLGNLNFDNDRFSSHTNTCPTDGTPLAASATCSFIVRFAPLADGTQTGFLSYNYGPDGIRRNNLFAKAALAGRSNAAPIGNTALSYNPSNWDFGDVAENQSVEKHFVLSNTSASAIYISNFTSSNARFTSANNCPLSPTSLAAGGTCQLTVTFTPNAEGVFSSDIHTIYGPDAARSSNLSAQLSVVGRSTQAPVGNPGLAFNPSYRDFGNLLPDTHSTLSLDLINIGSAALYLGTASVSDNEYSITANNCPTGSTPLASAASCTISVRYTPDDEGTDIAELRMNYGPDEARAQNLVAKSTLIGKSEPPPVGNSALTLTPNTYDFGNVGLSPAFANTVITVENTSARTLYLGDVLGLSAPYSVSTSTCPSSPAPFAVGASCTLTIRFEPIAGPQVTQSMTLNYGISTLNTAEYNSQAQFTGRSNPTPPSNFTFTDGTASTLNFSWEANDFDQASFQIERCDGVACRNNWTTSSTFSDIDPANRSFIASGLSEGEIYRFRIRGVAGATHSSWLTGPPVLVFGGITQVDNATGNPNSLAQIDCNQNNATGTYVGLYWNSVAHAAYYQVFDLESGSPVFIKNVSAPASSTVIQGLADNIDKSYLVKAFTINGVSSVNQTLSALSTEAFTPCAVIGQNSGDGTDFLRSFRRPAGMTTDGTRLFVSDRDNHRVLIWNNIPTSDNIPPDIVLGQPDFESITINNSGTKSDSSIVSDRSLRSPWGITVRGGKLYVADSGNHRVLVWNSIPTENFTPADFVLGQANMASSASVTGNNCNTAARNFGKAMSGPQGVHVDNDGYIYVVDTGNHRVLIWTSAINQNTQPANFVIGNPSMDGACSGAATSQSRMNSPSDVYVSGNDIFVADRNNHRVLLFNKAALADGMNASTVWGQSNFTANGSASTASRFSSPYSVWGDDSSGSDHIFVGDHSNNRVLRFDSSKFATNNATADGIIGQANFTANGASDDINRLRGAIGGLAIKSGPHAGVWVSAFNGDKINKYDYTEATTSDQPDAQLLLGAPRYGVLLERIAGIDQFRSLRYSGVSIAGEGSEQKTAVSDFVGNRVLLFNSPIQSNLPAASLVLGQSTFNGNLHNQGGTASAHTLNSPTSVWTDGTRVLTVDSGNHRILGWRNWPTTNNQAADFVIGQDTFTASGQGNGGINRLRSPAHIFVAPISGGSSDDVNILVADRDNYRVTIYQGTWKNTAPKFPADTGNAHAIVLGQSDTTSRVAHTVPNDSNLRLPRGVWSDGRAVVVADTDFNRVMIWNGATLPSTGQSADVVIGQDDFESNLANKGDAISSAGLDSPTSVWVDNDRLFVVDQNNHRILVWNSFSTLTNGKAADSVIGQSNMLSGLANGGNLYPSFDLFKYPYNLIIHAGRLFVTDGFRFASQATETNNRIIIRPSH
jgi:hypothetical protein